MDRSIRPFEVGDEVVCVKPCGCLLRGIKYIVHKLMICKKCGIWYIAHTPTSDINRKDKFPCCKDHVSLTDGFRYAKASHFRKINPYQSSVSRELAERAVESIGDGQDLKPVKVKEVLQ